MPDLTEETGAELQNPEGVVGLMLRLRSMGITDVRLMQAIESVPHNQFVPVAHFDKAWRNEAMPIACGQTMPSPDITCRMVAALNPQEGQSVLEIGTGSGYQTALLARLCKKVHSVDRYQTLLSAAQDRLERLGISNATFARGDAQDGPQAQGLYDAIVCDMAYEGMPRGLLDQLASGGRVIAAIGEPGEEQMLVQLTKIGSRFEREDLFPVRFGPLEKGVAAAL